MLVFQVHAHVHAHAHEHVAPAPIPVAPPKPTPKPNPSPKPKPKPKPNPKPKPKPNPKPKPKPKPKPNPSPKPNQSDVNLSSACGSVLKPLVAAAEEVSTPLVAPPEERVLLLYLGAAAAGPDAAGSDAAGPDGAESGAQAGGGAQAGAVCAEVGEHTLSTVQSACLTDTYVLWPAAARLLLKALPVDRPVAADPDPSPRHNPRPNPNPSPGRRQASGRLPERARGAQAGGVASPCHAVRDPFTVVRGSSDLAARETHAPALKSAQIVQKSNFNIFVFRTQGTSSANTARRSPPSVVR